MSLFHQCNVGEDLIDPLSPTSTSEEVQARQVRVDDDKNLAYALDEIFAEHPAARGKPAMQYESDHVSMIRDEYHNVVRYSLALENEGKPGIRNLVLTLTPKKEVFAHIFTYIPDDPDQLFFGIEEFTGEMIITDLEGDEIGRSYLTDGYSPGAEEEATNGRIASTDCYVVPYYVSVYYEGGSSHRLDYTEVWCFSSGSSGGSGGGECCAGGGGGGSGNGAAAKIAVNRALATVSSNSGLPSNPRDGQSVYIRNKDGSVTELVYIKELNAWLMPELVILHYNGKFEIEGDNGPTFNGEVLGAMGALALAEPSPVGEVIWVAAATVYVTVYAIDLLRHRYTYTPPPTVKELPWKPGVSPGPDWTWRGRTSNPEDGDGNWVRGEKPRMENLHPDFDHPPPIGPHWDYTDADGRRWRIFPDGRVEPK